MVKCSDEFEYQSVSQSTNQSISEFISILAVRGPDRN